MILGIFYYAFINNSFKHKRIFKPFTFLPKHNLLIISSISLFIIEHINGLIALLTTTIQSQINEW